MIIRLDPANTSDATILQALQNVPEDLREATIRLLVLSGLRMNPWLFPGGIGLSPNNTTESGGGRPAPMSEPSVRQPPDIGLSAQTDSHTHSSGRATSTPSLQTNPGPANPEPAGNHRDRLKTLFL